MTNPAPIDRPAVEAMIAALRAAQRDIMNWRFTEMSGRLDAVADMMLDCLTAYEAEKARADRLEQKWFDTGTKLNEARAALAKAFILTREINEYNQEGEYFVAWFRSKPTVEQVQKALSVTAEFAAWIVATGGGRQKYENEWYNLAEIAEGETP